MMNAGAGGRKCACPPRGPVAQLGARLNGIQKVRGSNPLRSTRDGRLARASHQCFKRLYPTDFPRTLPALSYCISSPTEEPCAQLVNHVPTLLR
jgi:hypothetical protein